MKSQTTEHFRKLLKNLPGRIQRQARVAYKLFRENPQHPSLYFKRVHSVDPIYSVRISVDYRAIGVYEGDVIIWFWIGSHADYDGIVSRL